jgi:hypothetical protein
VSKFDWATQTHSLLTILVCCIAVQTYSVFMCIPILYCQPVAAFFFTFFRALLFTFVGSYNAVVFGPKSVGRVAGIVYTSTAFFILMQTPLIHFTANQV